MKYKVTNKQTGEVRYLTSAELATLPGHARPAPRSHSKWPPITTDDLDRNVAIKLIRDALKKRSGKQWSVTGGRGTSWGWIEINSPPARRVNYEMTPADAAELAGLLGLDRAHSQGVSIAASSDHRREYIERARGQEPTKIAERYWD